MSQPDRQPRPLRRSALPSKRFTSWRFTLWGLSGITLLMMSCQPAPLPAPAPPAPETSLQPDASSSVPGRYESLQAGVRFAYPADFTIPDSRVGSTDDTLTLNLWQQEIYGAIAAGKYEGGTEYPPNVQVVIDRNPNNLDLQAWVEQQSDRFSLPQNFQPRAIAGQTGLSFRSTGLYEQENVVVAHPDGERIIAISLATIGVPQMDDPNRQAFNQVLDSFQFASAAQP